MGRSAKNNLKKVESGIQHLCCLGLSGQVAIPAVLRELHELVPSYANAFFWCDEQGNVANVYDERPDSADITPLYLREFYDRRELEVFTGWPRFVRESNRAMEFDELLTVDRRRFLNHEFYHEVLSKLKFDCGLHVVARENDQRLGALAMTRSAGEPAFSGGDARHLERLSGFIAHALLRDEKRDYGWVESCDEGFAVAGPEGKFEWVSGRGRQFLFMVAHDRISSDTPGLDGDLELPGPLRRMCARLSAVRAEQPVTEPPVWCTDSQWGRFVFRAHYLEPERETEGPIAISIKRRQPLPEKLLRRIRAMPLTRRQAEVGLFMALGHAYNDIAGRLGIAEHTAISHSRQVYNKLGVNNRSELLARLLSD